MTPNRFDITGGPSEYAFTQAFHTFRSRDGVGICLDPTGYEYELLISGYDHADSASPGRYTFRGKVVSRLRDDQRFDSPVEGWYDTHKREGWLRMMCRYRLVHLFADEGEAGEAFLDGGWNNNYLTSLVFPAVVRMHRYWDEEPAETVRYFVEELTGEGLVRIQEVRVTGEEPTDFEVIRLTP